jgi:outer membrane protein assembly factor BamA
MRLALLHWVCLWGLMVCIADRAEAGSEHTTPPDSVQNIRGTEQPLPNKVSPLRYAARGLLFVPYAAVETAIWPITTLARLNEEHHLVTKAADLMTFHPGSYRTTVGPMFGFESSLGISAVGLNIRGRDWLGTGTDLKLGLGYVNSDRNLAAGGFEHEGDHVEWSVSARQEQLEDRPFYGIGPGSPEQRTDYNARMRLLEAEVTGWPQSTWKPTLSVYLRDLDLSRSSSATSMSDVFPEIFAASENGRYTGTELGLAYDTRNADDYSSQGVLVQALGGHNHSLLSEDADYWNYQGELQKFFGLRNGSRSFMFRVFAEGIEPDGDGDLPLAELPRLGGKTGLRGYSRFRFADHRSLELNFAYRYPVTNRVLGEVFVDWGSVAPTWQELSLSHTDPSLGFGLMFNSKYGPLFSFHVAGNSESIQVAVSTTSIFKTGSRRKP